MSVKVARSPSPALDQINQQFGAISLSKGTPSPLVAPSQPQALSKKVLDFFSAQQRIGAQWPKTVYPMKYDVSVYRQADVGCYSSVDSKDWRKREISIRVTDAAIDLIDEVLRKPIAEATKKACEGVTVQNMKEKWKGHYVNTSIQIKDVPNFPRQNPAETKIEYTRFKFNPTAKSILVAIPQTQLLEIAKKIQSFWIPEGSQIPGPVLFEDIDRRVRNIFKKLMQPELACMLSIDCNPMKPEVKAAAPGGFVEKTMYGSLSHKITRQARASGMNPRLVDSLVEPYLREGTEIAIIETTRMIVEGLTGDGIGALSW